jgi:hypothetical protein
MVVKQVSYATEHWPDVAEVSRLSNGSGVVEIALLEDLCRTKANVLAQQGRYDEAHRAVEAGVVTTKFCALLLGPSSAPFDIK